MRTYRRSKALVSKDRKVKRRRLPDDEENTNTSSSLAQTASRQASSGSWQHGILINPNHAPKGLNRSLSVTYELQEGEDALVACATFVTVGVGLRGFAISSQIPQDNDCEVLGLIYIKMITFLGCNAAAELPPFCGESAEKKNFRDQTLKMHTLQGFQKWPISSDDDQNKF